MYDIKPCVECKHYKNVPEVRFGKFFNFTLFKTKEQHLCMRPRVRNTTSIVTGITTETLLPAELCADERTTINHSTFIQKRLLNCGYIGRHFQPKEVKNNE